MGSRNWSRTLLAGAGVIALSLLGSVDADARRRKPAPPPPPTPPPVVVIPYRPIPPNSASPNFRPPMRGIDGLYRSVNRGITPAQTLWNLRSAYNVAALNCSPTEFPTIVDSYRAFLRTHARALTATNRKVDTEFRALYGARFVAPREKYMTEVYNSFALPMTLTDFCNAVLAVSRDGVAAASLTTAPVTVVQLEAFAARSLPSVQIVFDDFYRRYEQWRVEVAAWDARYAPRPIVLPGVPIVLPGVPVAVTSARP